MIGVAIMICGTMSWAKNIPKSKVQPKDTTLILTVNDPFSLVENQIFPADSIDNKEISWSGDNKNIKIEKGIIYADSAGSARLIAKCGYSCTVIVLPTGYDVINIEERNTLKKDLDKLKTENAHLKKQIEDIHDHWLMWVKTHPIPFFIIIAALFLSVIILTILFVFSRKKAKKQFKLLRRKIENNAYFYDSEKAGLEKKLQESMLIKAEYDKIKNKYIQLIRQQEKNSPLTDSATREKRTTPIPPVRTGAKKNLYADAINKGEFYNVSQLPGDRSVFELELSNNSSFATFKVYPGAEKRVIDRPNYLADCEKEVIGNESLETVTLGEARKSGDKWIIDKPLKVKIV